MREISVFDVIGPNMIGPSSSHTAGALRIARMAGKMAKAPILRVRFVLYGSFARTYQGHGTDRALVGGILGYEPEDKRIRRSLEIAKEQGIDVSFEINTTRQDVHPNTVEIIAEDQDGDKIDVIGESIGGGSARLRSIDGIEVDITGELETLVIMQLDVPGVIAAITQHCYEERINIAYLNCYRERKHEKAFSVIEVDGDIPPRLVEKIRELPAVLQVNLISL